MEGPKTEALEASGLSEIVKALPGVAEKNADGSLTVQDGFSGDAVVSGLADGMATHMGLQFQNPFLQAITYHGSSFVFLEVSELVFDGLSGFTGGGTIGFSIAQLKVS